VTDPQPNKTHFDTTQPRLNKNSSQDSTNHVRVHAAHDREHGCYNSFTLCRGCTRSPRVMIILEKLNTHCTDEHSYTLPRCVLGNCYKAVQWSHLACNIPIEVSLSVLASHPPRTPLLCLMGSSHHSCTHAIPQFSHRSFIEHPSGSTIAASPHSWLVCQDKTPPRTVFMGGRSMNRSLDLGIITNHKLPASHQTTTLNRRHHTN
jgi:hypothetical protein